jgi:Tfp pilus assembly protein PilV
LNHRGMSLKEVLVATLAVVIFVGLCVGGVAGCKEFNRAQKRADARNRTEIVKQEIKTAEQRARVNRAQIAATKAEAEKRVEEAKGIRHAQDLISETLTPLYVQHEAIKAQQASNQDRIYIPVGPQGIPLVNDIGGTK